MMREVNLTMDHGLCMDYSYGLGMRDYRHDDEETILLRTYTTRRVRAVLARPSGSLRSVCARAKLGQKKIRVVNDKSKLLRPHFSL